MPVLRARARPRTPPERGQLPSGTFADRPPEAMPCVLWVPGRGASVHSATAPQRESSPDDHRCRTFCACSPERIRCSGCHALHKYLAHIDEYDDEV